MSLKTNEDGILLRRLIRAKGGSTNAIDSYNYFVKILLRNILSQEGVLLSDGKKVFFTDPLWGTPKEIGPDNEEIAFWPNMARRMKFNYMAKLTSHVGIYTPNLSGGYTLSQITTSPVLLGKVPVMVGSALCHLADLSPDERFEKGEAYKDPGGYFINKGVEKVILNTNSLRNNYPLLFVYDSGDKDHSVSYTSASLTETSIILVNEKVTTRGSGSDVPKSIHGWFSSLGSLDPTNHKKRRSFNIFHIFYVLREYRGVLLDKIQYERNRLEDEQRSMKGLPPLERKEKVFETIKEKMDGTIREALAMMLTLIVDVDPKRQARRRKEFLYYTKLTEKAFRLEPEEGDKDVYGIVANQLIPLKIPSITNVSTIEERNTEISKFFVRNLFINVPYNEKDAIKTEIAILNKMRTFATMIVKYVEFKTGYVKPDDRDSWGFKRVQNAGIRMEMLFTRFWKGLLRDLRDKMQTRKPLLNEVISAIDQKFLETKFTKIFSIGKQGKKDSEITIIDTLKRDNRLDTISHLFRLSSPGKRKTATRKKRLMDKTELGIKCPVMSPEGEAAGLVGDPSQIAFVSKDRDLMTILEFLENNGKGAYFSTQIVRTNNTVRDRSLYFNGVHIGFCNSDEVYNLLIEARRRQNIDFDVAIIKTSDGNLWIYANSGRMCRPLLVVDPETRTLVIDKKNLRNESLRTMMDEGALEYMDAFEQLQSNVYIAYSKEHLLKTKVIYEKKKNNPHKFFTHCELDPAGILGASASIIPYPEFSQGPRNTYEASMGHQAMGPNSSRIENRFDTTVYTLREPGLPIVATDAHTTYDLDLYPIGQQMLMSIAIYTKDTQEDAVVINQDIIDRGQFRYEAYHSVTVILKQENSIITKLGIPKHSQSDDSKYRHLDHENPIVKVGTYVKSGDCLIGISYVDTSKTVPVIRNGSIYVEKKKEGVVVEVLKTTDQEGSDMYRFRIRAIYDIETGDKFASRYSQKGTVGRTLPGTEMPVIISGPMAGLSPGLIFNPHGIPSRMTIGKLDEIAVSKAAAMECERINATPFRGPFQERTRELLIKNGFKSNGKEKMIHGATGRVMEAEILTGFCYYQLLKHLVRFKMQARGTGSVQLLTRQPLSGIRKEGGLRLGEMERDAILGHGSSYLLNERTMHSSDGYRTVVCSSCGMIATSNELLNEISCKGCSKKEFGTVEIPYVFKLMTQTLAGANIRVSMETKPKSE